ncbi:unnamed protein product [Leptosia nina]|uniref:Asteroid domain-containing protein n=1 Tax=Leptosia nina TaxID=320188 RepID=A0AAV1JJR8_9NEOP
MGVRGLTTYINHNSNVFMKDHNLHDTNLVIDGHSLCAQLYRSLNCFSAFGGDYDKFANYMKTFFKNLKKCNITSYVIFDGSYEKRKLKTAHNRLRSKIYGAAKLDPVTQGTIQLFPLLLRDLFKGVLNEINVLYTVCEFEADDEIAALARCLNCPVLSYDSDFYIYNVLYIPFNTVELKPVQIKQGDQKIYVIHCQIYKVEFLTEHFGGINKELLPLLATLLGNDFVEKKVFSKFFSQLKMPKSKNKNEQQRCIHGLFIWLQNESLESAISKIIGRLKKREKEKVFEIIKKSINGYHKKDCRSLKYLNLSYNIPDKNVDIKMPQDMNDDVSVALEEEQSGDDDNSSEEEIESKTELNELPDWFADGIRQKTIPHSFINLYTHHLYFCSPQAEDYMQEDSHFCILPILRYAFDILTDFEEEYFTYVSRDRDCNYKRILINKDVGISRLLEIPFSRLTKVQLHLYFYHFFKEKFPKIDFDVVELLPSNFQIFALAIIWWVSSCDVLIGQVHSLLLSYTYLEAVDEKVGMPRASFNFNNRFSNKLVELKSRPHMEMTQEIQTNKNKVQYNDCLIAASVLLKHFELDDTIRKRPKSYDSKRVHAFAQLQCCLLAINSLNILCGSPFEGTDYARSYNGTFIYNIAMKVESEKDPLSFFKEYLKGAYSVLWFYNSLNVIVTRLLDKNDLRFKEIATGSKKRSRRKKKTDDEISFIIKGFESEVKI